jgi:hypothetical protein
MGSLMRRECVAPAHQWAKLFFLCVLGALGEWFAAMADSDQLPDTGASFRQSKRELFVMLGAWVVAFVWVVGYGKLNAYSVESGRPIELVMGIPSWTFYGWLLPLMSANLFTVWFCLKFMKDEPMEEVPEEE